MNTGDDDVIVCFDIKVRTDTGRERGQILLTLGVVGVELGELF